MIELLIIIVFIIIIIIKINNNYKKNQINKEIVINNQNIQLNEYEQKYQDIINYIYNNLNDDINNNNLNTIIMI